MIFAAILFAVVTARPHDEFFIVSSVDAPHARVVMKRPTDVTVVVRVPATAKLRGEHGEPLHLTDLRSGDTVYAVISTELVVSSIRRGPMTVEELRRRYLPELRTTSRMRSPRSASFLSPMP